MEEAEAEAEAEEDRGGGRVGDADDFREETKAVDAVLSPVPGSAAETEGDGVTEWSGLAGDDMWNGRRSRRLRRCRRFRNWKFGCELGKWELGSANAVLPELPKKSKVNTNFSKYEM
jgi:hypothetical protein